MKHLSKNLILLIFAGIFVLVGTAFRVAGLGLITGDLFYFVIPWYDQLVQKGFSALGGTFYNYTPPYLYLLWILSTTHAFLANVLAIKLLSILFDVINTALVYQILKIRYPQGLTALTGATLFFVLPTVALDSAWWGSLAYIFF
jgi:Gpi18-like mannosyltransferase